MTAYNKNMGSYQENCLSKHPQSLCHMCGRCCRVRAIPKLSYDELKKLQTQGDEEAVNFLKMFVPYSSTDDAREVDNQMVESTLQHYEACGISADDITFYCCKYLLDNNACSIYEERPEFCIRFPENPWKVIPSGCGYEGWMFLMREKDKKKIRKSKEDLLELKLLKKKMKNPEDLSKIKAVENKIYSSIEKYSQYGSENW